VDAVLTFESVTKRYGDVVAVAGSSFAVARGSFVALLGPSGCGKTTTLRLIAGFEQPDEGVILLDGRRANDVAPHRRPVNTVFQDFGLFPHMSVFDNVAFGPRLRGDTKEKLDGAVREMLDLVRLSGMERRRPHELSGGQQQRVALARALVNRPTVLLLDEPLSNLDYKLRREMRGELKRIQRDVKTTFMIVTHDREEALTLADDVIVMKSGSIQQMGAPMTLYSRPVNPFVADFLGNANFLDGTVTAQAEAETLFTVNRSTEVFRAGGSRLAAGAPVLACIRPEDIELVGERPATDHNVSPGIVEELFYLGQSFEIVVRLNTGHVIQCVEIQRERGRPAFGVGDRAFVAWSPRDTLLFEAR
jgi:spermidine/putrescine transport system ATP-binding protein